MQPQEKKKKIQYLRLTHLLCPMFEGSSFQDVMDKFLFMERQTLSRGGRKKKGNRPTVEKSGGPKNSRGIFFGFKNIYIFRFPQGKEKKRKKGILLTQKRSHSIGAREREPGRPMDIILKKKKAPYGLFWL